MALDQDLRERLLAPIDGGAGVDGREDEGDAGDLLREIRFQRKSIIRSEQRLAMGEDPEDEENWSWSALMDVSRDYLIDHGKDLEPAAVFLEASTRVDGLVGLVTGTTLLADLVAGFWDNGLYPREDEDDGIEARFQPLSGLSGGGSDKEGPLVVPIRQVVLAGDPVNGELVWNDRVLANNQFASAQGAKREAQVAEAQETLDGIDALTRKLPRAQIERALERVTEAEAAWRRAVGFISERTKPRFPAASKVSDELRAMREWLAGVVAKLPSAAAAAEEAPAAAAAASDTAGAAGAGMVLVPGAPFSIGGMARREDALRAVTAAADFFEKFEPLSPIGSALRDIDRRARMSFADLLAELIPDGGVRETYYWRSGIKPPGGGGAAGSPASVTGTAAVAEPAPAAKPVASSSSW